MAVAAGIRSVERRAAPDTGGRGAAHGNAAPPVSGRRFCGSYQLARFSAPPVARSGCAFDPASACFGVERFTTSSKVMPFRKS